MSYSLLALVLNTTVAPATCIALHCVGMHQNTTYVNLVLRSQSLEAGLGLPRQEFRSLRYVQQPKVYYLIIVFLQRTQP